MCVPPRSDRERGAEVAAIKYDHQLRMLSALTKKFRETYQELSERDAANLARQRMERLGSGWRDLFDLEEGLSSS